MRVLLCRVEHGALGSSPEGLFPPPSEARETTALRTPATGLPRLDTSLASIHGTRPLPSTRCRSAACCSAKVARRALRLFTNQYLVRPQVSHHLEKFGQVIGTCTLEIQVRVPRPLAIILHHLLAVLSCLSLLC